MSTPNEDRPHGSEVASGRGKGLARKQAVAIRYDPAEEVAPIVVGQGQGYIAERIVAIAKEHGIYIHTDPNLVALLMDVQIDEAIPPQLYQVVAKVLGLVYRVNRDLARKRGLV